MATDGCPERSARNCPRGDSEEGYTDAGPFCSDGPRLDEFLAEMRREVFEGREGYMNVGEAPGITPERNEFITDPAHKELDMLFLFDHVASTRKVPSGTPCRSKSGIYVLVLPTSRRP